MTNKKNKFASSIDSESDSTPLTIKHRGDDFVGVVSSAVSSIPIRQIIFLFIAFIIITSDVFTTRIMNKIPKATVGTSVSSRGAVLQGLMLCLVFIIGHALITNDVI